MNLDTHISIVKPNIIYFLFFIQYLLIIKYFFGNKNFYIKNYCNINNKSHNTIMKINNKMCKMK